jgi:transposase InsO family protein
MGISTSTFYAIEKRIKNPNAEKEDADLRDMIESIILEFPGYGYRRVTKHLQREGHEINHKRILRIMKNSDLLCVLQRSFKVTTTDSNHGYPRYPNLAKEITLTGVNQLWVADITYIRITRGFVYLAMIMDAYSRKIVGYALSENIDTRLALSALKAAIETRKPAAGCVHHSDQGIQYCSKEYTDYLHDNEFGISMSRRGNCYDNAMAESFFKTLKREEVYLWDYQTIDDVRESVSHFVEQVYNAKRLHSSLGYYAPDVFEKSLGVKLIGHMPDRSNLGLKVFQS